MDSNRESTAAKPELPMLVRPRFFAGQLLTDRDLTALEQWVDSRLGLVRHRHGWGVVCGLTVQFDPKDPGKLSVRAGPATRWTAMAGISFCSGPWSRSMPPRPTTVPPAHVPASRSRGPGSGGHLLGRPLEGHPGRQHGGLRSRAPRRAGGSGPDRGDGRQERPEMRVHQHQGRRGDRVPDPRTWREAAAAGAATPTADKDAAIQLLGDFQAKFSDLFSVTPGSAVPDHLQDVQKWLTERIERGSPA